MATTSPLLGLDSGALLISEEPFKRTFEVLEDVELEAVMHTNSQ